VGAAPQAQVYTRAKFGSGFWAQHLFSSKTFVEARSMAAPFVAFWRVYSFHAVLFTMMAAVVSSSAALEAQQLGLCGLMLENRLEHMLGRNSRP